MTETLAAFFGLYAGSTAAYVGIKNMIKNGIPPWNSLELLIKDTEPINHKDIKILISGAFSLFLSIVFIIMEYW